MQAESSNLLTFSTLFFILCIPYIAGQTYALSNGLYFSSACSSTCFASSSVP